MDSHNCCREKLAADPFSGCAYIFRSRSAKSIRLLVYDGQGLYLVSPRDGFDSGRAATDQRDSSLVVIFEPEMSDEVFTLHPTKRVLELH